MLHIGKKWIPLDAVLLVGQVGFASNPIDWLLDFSPLCGIKDKRVIKAILRLPKADAQAVELYFKKHDKDAVRDNLGFGWTVWKAGVSGWDIAISATFYYNRDSLVSYSLSPNYSEQKGKLKRQQKRLCSVFQVLDDTAQSYVFNQSALFAPLKNYPGHLHQPPTAIGQYMSPLSGTEYGFMNYRNDRMTNRRAFNAIKDSLTNEQIICMMYAVNPATRFTGIEHYWRFKERFGERPDLDAWVEQSFAAFPEMTTYGSCSNQKIDTWSLVYSNSVVLK